LLEKIATHLKISYDYEEANQTASPADKTDISWEDLSQVPQPLVAGLQDAVSDGNTGLMNQLIAKVRDSEASASAAGLQQLVDNYDYDSLMKLLLKVSRP
jgi:hypothetical protein